MKDKVILISGADSALGRQLVSAFANLGARLALGIRERSQMHSFQVEMHTKGVDAFIVPCDIRFEEQVIRMVHQVMHRFKRVDVLVNAAAAMGIIAPLVDYPSDAWGEVISTHITGTYLVCREVLPWMTRQNAGSIINLTSNIAGEIPPQAGAFLVSACGVEGMTRLLASELRGTGVRANAVELNLSPAVPDEADLPHMIDACLWLASDESASANGQRFARRVAQLH